MIYLLGILGIRYLANAKTQYGKCNDDEYEMKTKKVREQS
tara:strand:+ start:139 stop:258 length:120 start_codon:yes stop_codon:yes gene_type:complete